MTGRPIQDVRIWSIQHRPAKVLPWIVRWSVDGNIRSRSFRTKAEADRRRSQLLVAQQRGERFDPATGEPESWAPPAPALSVYSWAQMWVAEEWGEWAPRTRRSQVEALARFVPLAVQVAASTPPSSLRRHLVAALAPGADRDSHGDEERWLKRWSLPLSELTLARLADIDRQLGIGDRGQQLGPTTAGRFRQIARSCVRRAVELGHIPADPWPPTPKGRARRKARRQEAAVEVERLPDPAGMAAVIAAIPSNQPGSRTYQVMTAVAYYAGLRPSEVVMLRPRNLRLPEDGGWGLIHVVEADDGTDEPADPKTGKRSVPVPPQLVEVLRAWLVEYPVQEGDLMFRTRSGRRPSQANWNRALHRAAAAAGSSAISPYDCRHACATAWLSAGVPLGEAARRLGHSVETLVAHYVGALQGDDIVANMRIETALASASFAIG